MNSPFSSTKDSTSFPAPDFSHQQAIQLFKGIRIDFSFASACYIPEGNNPPPTLFVAPNLLYLEFIQFSDNIIRLTRHDRDKCAIKCKSCFRYNSRAILWFPGQSKAAAIRGNSQHCVANLTGRRHLPRKKHFIRRHLSMIEYKSQTERALFIFSFSTKFNH